MKERAPWYSFPRFEFWRKHVDFALDHAVTFERGVWPQKPQEGGYTDPPATGKPQSSSEAPFVKPLAIWAEIILRLEQCGWDGIDCRDYYLGKITMSALCRVHKCDEDSILRMFNRVKAYISSGYCKRWEQCSYPTCEYSKRCKRVQRVDGILRLPLQVTYTEFTSHTRGGHGPTTENVRIAP